MAEKYSKFDVVDYLKTDEARLEYLDAAMEDGDPAFIAAAIGDLVRSQGTSEISRKTGVTRMGLYKGLSKTGNPSFATVLAVSKELGIKWVPMPIKAAALVRTRARKKATPRRHLGVFRKSAHQSR